MKFPCIRRRPWNNRSSIGDNRDVVSLRRRAIFAALVSGLLVLALAACSGHTVGAASSGNGVQAEAAPPHPLRVVDVTVPKHLGPRRSIVVRFSAALRTDTPTPVLSPKVAGDWVITGATARFRPAGGYPPQAKLTLTIPSGTSGVVGQAGGLLGHSKVVHAQTGTPGPLFAEQILARLHYLPLKTSAPAPTSLAQETSDVFTPPAGRFTWRFHNTPSALASQWNPDSYNTLLQGALVDFQHQADITADGFLGPQTWAALLRAQAANRVDPAPYTYIYANLAERPQTLSVWKDGSIVITSPTNGGVPGALTPVGTFPIYERLTSTTMSGTNPDGSHYSDPGVPWVNYFSGGSAVHGFPRASYGSPQSVGCLELPIATAHVVFDTVGYGTLVTVYNDTDD